MIAKILINTSVSKLNKVYDYMVPNELETEVQIGKRVEVSFGNKKTAEEGIIVKLIENNEYTGKYKLKPIVSVLDEISYIDEKRLKFAKYISHIYFCNVYDALKLMLPPGTKSKNSKKTLNTRQDTAIRLIKNQDEIMNDIENNVITSAKHIQLLTFLMYNDLVLVNDVIDGLGISRAVINTVCKNGYIELYKTEPEIDLLSDLNVEKSYAKNPTEEQKKVIDNIGSYIYEEKFNECLLFGVTGSGKTEVYLQLIEKVLMQGRKAIVLVPEISLTYQTVNRFVSRFGNNVAILHSKMTIAKRKEEYKRIKTGNVDIVVGARSAIFAPIDNIGLVVIDEEHDQSYYSGSTPKYSTKEIARYLCKENDAVLLLGSATPEITSFYKAKSEKIDLQEMKQRPGAAALPDIELVDIKEDRLFGNTSNITNRLKQEILKNINNKEQTMLFLNKRGYTSFFTCKDCGYIFKCPNCDVAMTYHKTSNLLLCHYCLHVEKNVSACHKCGSNNITSGSLGTQKLEEELKEIYPDISILRMDADTTIARDSHQKILDKFRNEKIDVLIGTQMISKGHDFENVTLVGVLGVDQMLAMNDYSASEKAFANISQVAGRAGRGEKRGRVLIQTSDPSNYILQSIKNNDYEEFYQKEIEHREIFNFPPFSDIILFELIGKDFSILKVQADLLYNILNNNTGELYKVFTPKSPFVQRINNKYRINILIKTKISTDFYNLIFKKLDEYDKKKKSGISLSIVKNPTYLN